MAGYLGLLMAGYLGLLMAGYLGLLMAGYLGLLMAGYLGLLMAGYLGLLMAGYLGLLMAGYLGLQHNERNLLLNSYRLFFFSSYDSLLKLEKNTMWSHCLPLTYQSLTTTTEGRCVYGTTGTLVIHSDLLS